jgi:hypothetical protein
MFALHTLFPLIILPGATKKKKKKKTYNDAPLLSQSKVLDPEYFPHLFSQSVGPLKLIEVVPNDGATVGPLVERVELQVDV